MKRDACSISARSIDFTNNVKGDARCVIYRYFNSHSFLRWKQASENEKFCLSDVFRALQMESCLIARKFFPCLFWKKYKRWKSETAETQVLFFFTLVLSTKPEDLLVSQDADSMAGSQMRGCVGAGWREWSKRLRKLNWHHPFFQVSTKMSQVKWTESPIVAQISPWWCAGNQFTCLSEGLDARFRSKRVMSSVV